RACPPAGQRLRLVTAGKECELLRVRFPDLCQALSGDGQRLVPFNLTEFSGAARAAAQKRLLQAGRTVMLQDAGAAFAAELAAIDRMVLVAVDVTDLAVTDVHVDAAAARAHIAGRLGDPVRNVRRGLHPIVFVGGPRIREWLL